MANFRSSQPGLERSTPCSSGGEPRAWPICIRRGAPVALQHPEGGLIHVALAQLGDLDEGQVGAVRAVQTVFVRPETANMVHGGEITAGKLQTTETRLWSL